MIIDPKLRSYEPDDEVVIDHMLDEFYNGECWNEYAHKYALDKVTQFFHAYPSWVEEFILTEEYDDRATPIYNQLTEEQRDRFRDMHSMYWSFRAMWQYRLIATMNAKNIRESEFSITHRYELQKKYPEAYDIWRRDS